MTANANVIVTVTDPDRLIAGIDPMAPFVVATIKLYRYATEALARADTTGAGGALVTTFTLVASTTEAADPNIAGPYRWGYYDSAQTAASWYRYLFADATAANLSLLSAPWQSDDRSAYELREILYEVGGELGEYVKRGTATAGGSGTVTCAALFKSTARDASFYVDWNLACTFDAGAAAAAPEGEEGLIASVDTSTGIATLEQPFSATLASGDTILLSALLPVATMIRIINRTREQMEFVETVDIALSSGEDRYPAPAGVYSETDILDGVGIRSDNTTYSNREDEWSVPYGVVRDGNRVWIETPLTAGLTPILRLRVLRNWRDAEGPLTAMGDTTTMPIGWWRPCFAYAIALHLTKTDPGEVEFQRLLGTLKDEAAAASGKYAPEIVRKLTSKQGRRILPGPRWIA